MNLLLNIVIVVFVGLIIEYSYNNLRNENKILRKDIDELQYKLLTYENGGIFEECDKRLKEFNEIMFGSPPLKNKVVIVRSIKDYDYSAYRKDIEALNEYLKDGWSIVNHESSEFVHTYILGKPLAWTKEGVDMMSEKSKENRNKWYRDHVNKYCVCVNKDEVEVVDYIEDLLKSKNFSKYVKNKIKEDLEKRK